MINLNNDEAQIFLAYYAIQGEGDDLYCLYDSSSWYAEIKLHTVDANVKNDKYGYKFFKEYNKDNKYDYDGSYSNDVSDKECYNIIKKFKEKVLGDIEI